MAFGQQAELRDLLAASTTFQAEVGVGTKADALSYIHRFQALEDYHAGSRAVVRFTRHSSFDAGHQNWKSDSTLLLEVELWRDLPADNATGLSAQEEEVLGKFAAIEEHLKTAQGTDKPPAESSATTYLRIVRLDMVEYDVDGSGEVDEGQIEDPETGGTQQLKWWMRWEVTTK